MGDGGKLEKEIEDDRDRTTRRTKKYDFNITGRTSGHHHRLSPTTREMKRIMHDSTTVADIFSYSPLFQLPDSIIIFYGTFLDTHSFQVEMKRVTVTRL